MYLMISTSTRTLDDHTSQYSPSISHDEKEEEDSWEGIEEELAESGGYTEGQDIHRSNHGIHVVCSKLYSVQVHCHMQIS